MSAARAARRVAKGLPVHEVHWHSLQFLTSHPAPGLDRTAVVADNFRWFSVPTWLVFCPCRDQRWVAAFLDHGRAVAWATWHVRQVATVAGHPPWPEWGDPAAWDRARQ